MHSKHTLVVEVEGEASRPLPRQPPRLSGSGDGLATRTSAILQRAQFAPSGFDALSETTMLLFTGRNIAFQIK